MERQSILEHLMPSLLIMLACVCMLCPGSAGAEPPSPSRQNELINLLRHDCGACHGMTLKGGLGPALTGQALADKPYPLLVNTIMHGREGTAMPPWAGILSREEIAWLVEQLRRGGPDSFKGSVDE